MKKGGRKRDYTPYQLVEKLSSLGLTREEMRAVTGLSKKQFEWRMRTDKRFADIVKSGRQEANRLVEQALFRRAIGYQVESTEVHEYYDSNDRVLNKKKVKKVQHIPPDTKAALEWLYNRDPERWKKALQLDVKNSLSFVEQSRIANEY